MVLLVLVTTDLELAHELTCADHGAAGNLPFKPGNFSKRDRHPAADRRRLGGKQRHPPRRKSASCAPSSAFGYREQWNDEAPRPSIRPAGAGPRDVTNCPRCALGFYRTPRESADDIGAVTAGRSFGTLALTVSSHRGMASLGIVLSIRGNDLDHRMHIDRATRPAHPQLGTATATPRSGPWWHSGRKPGLRARRR